MLDTRLLLGAQGVTLPDPMAGAQQALSLAQLARAGQIQQEAMAEARRKREAEAALQQVLGDLQAGGFSDDAIRAAVAKAPQAGNAILEIASKARKARAEEDKSRAEVESKRTDTNVKRFGVVGAIAGALARNPTREAWLAARENIKALGFDPAMLDVPNGMDPAQYFGQLAQSSMTRAQQLDTELKGQQFEETKRRNLATEGLTLRGQDLTAETARRGQDLSAQTAREGHRVTMRGQDLTDARAREGLELKRQGSKLDQKKEEARQDAAITQANNVINTVREAKETIGLLSAGWGQKILGEIPGSDARHLRNLIDTVKANIGFRELQQMREMSPTGGALGQVAIQELNMLQSTIAALDPQQSPDQLKRQLDKIEQHFSKWKNAVEQARAQGGGQQSSGQTMSTPPDPTKFAGKRMRAPDGRIYRSDGKRWIPE